MTTLTWLHVSDLQISADQSRSYESNPMLAALREDISVCLHKFNLKPDFLAITGDVAYAGRPADYEAAVTYLKQLLEITGLTGNRLFVVPGNHDVDRSKVTPAAQTIARSLTDASSVQGILAERSTRHLLLAGLANYDRFVGKLTEGCLSPDRDSLFFQCSLQIETEQVAILGLNTVWLALPDLPIGQVILGESQVRSALKQTDRASFRVALMHHPFDWLAEFDRETVEPLLLDNCDVILQSSQHSSGPTVTRSANLRATVIGANTRSGRQDASPRYNFVRIDLSSRKTEVFLRAYADTRGGFWAADTLALADAPNGVLRFALSEGRSRPPMPLRVTTARTAELRQPYKISFERVELANFRCFEDNSFPLSEKFTVIIGDNRAGKSALLEALAHGLGVIASAMQGRRAAPISRDQVRLVRHRYGETSRSELQFPVRISYRAKWGKQSIEWRSVREGTDEPLVKPPGAALGDLIDDLQAAVREGRNVTLPVFAYYGTGRLWREPNNLPEDENAPPSRLDGYRGCLEPASHLGGLVKWMKKQEQIALQRKSNRMYDGVKQAIKNAMGGVQDLLYDLEEEDVVVCFSSGETLPFRLLSEGVRNMLGMVADIAYRAAILNPHLAEKVCQSTPGIVLIDEIDLHLHPKWQRRVVDDLRRTFPQLQFIATTHSPFIVQSLRPGDLIDLEKKPSGEYANRSIEDITEVVMGVPVPQRSYRYQQMYEAAQEYYRVLQEVTTASPAEKENLKKRLDELVAPFSDNVAYHAFLEMQRIAAEHGVASDETD